MVPFNHVNVPHWLPCLELSLSFLLHHCHIFLCPDLDLIVWIIIAVIGTSVVIFILTIIVMVYCRRKWRSESIANSIDYMCHRFHEMMLMWFEEKQVF